MSLSCGGPVPGQLLLFLALPASPVDFPIALAIAAYAALAWELREELEPLLTAFVRSRVDGATAEAFGLNAISVFRL
jgi:hypothetical protein